MITMILAQTETITNSFPSISCRHCGSLGPHAIGPGAGPHHAQLLCGACGRNIRWLSARSPEEQAAYREQTRQQAMVQRPPSVRQLAYLGRLGYSGAPLMTMASASVAISALLTQRRQEGQP